MKIEKLTEEQETLIPVFRDKWIEIGRTAGPADREAAKDAISRAYECAGLKTPSKFVFVRSPMEAIIKIQEIDPSQNKMQIVNDMIYGFNDAGWLSYYDYWLNVINLVDCKMLEPLMDFAKVSGWANIYEDLVVIQDRPVEILFDEQGRLHNEFGPAIQYSDGFVLYSWHGTQVPSEWIEDKKDINPELALTWNNVEQRRCLCEILGWVNVLDKLNSVVINEDDDPEIGVLLEVDIPEIGREKFLKVRCGTGREFALPVPPEMKTALQANAWTYGLEPWEYKPELRT
jgi:hypothetical protein